MNNTGRRQRRFAFRSYLSDCQYFAGDFSGQPARRPFFRSERLEPRMLLSGLLDEETANGYSPAASDIADEWVPYIPSAEQTELAVRTVNGMTTAAVAMHFGFPAYRVTDWGAVTRQQSTFYVDAKVEQWTVPHIDLYVPTTLSHEYELGSLEPGGEYEFVFSAWGKVVDKCAFTISPRVPVLTIVASDAVAREPEEPTADITAVAEDHGQFMIQRIGPLDRSLIVRLKISGSATEGTDYQLKPQYPVYTFAPLPPGQMLVALPEGQRSCSVDVIAQWDKLIEGQETVVLTLLDASDYEVGRPASARVTIEDRPVDRWVPYVPTAEQTELAVTTVGGLTSALVTLQFGSPGFEVRDWGTVRRDGSRFVVDTKIERWTGPVIMVVPPPVTHEYELGHLAPGEYSFTFQAWGRTVESVAFKVERPTLPVVSIVAADPVATEPVRGGPQGRLGQFRVMRAGPAEDDLLVHLTVSGTASRGADYLFGPLDSGPFDSEMWITVPAGHLWVPIPVLARADAEKEGVETVILTVSSEDTYIVGSQATATVRILDTPSPVRRIWDPVCRQHCEVPVCLPGSREQLDLGGDSLIVYLPDGQAMSEVLDHVTNLVRSGRNGGTWTGWGIVSSAAARDARTCLAVVPDDGGQSIWVKYTWNGDANLDGRVDADDYFRIDLGFLSRKEGYHNGDFNYDGRIDADDYFLIDQAFLGQRSSLAESVPEPARIILSRRLEGTEASVVAGLFCATPLL